MSIRSVVQDVALAVGLDYPTLVYGATDREWREMRATVAEAVATITKAHDWQALRRIATFTGTGAAASFDLPADYARMLKKASLWSSRSAWGLAHIVDSDEWLEMERGPNVLPAGAWTLFGGQVHIRPTMAAGETARFFYVTRQAVAGGKTDFTADGDGFVLDERLLKLCVIQLWKQKKGQDSTDELADYEVALVQAIDEDGGAKPVLSGNTSGRGRPNVWPGTVRP